MPGGDDPWVDILRPWARAVSVVARVTRTTGTEWGMPVFIFRCRDCQYEAPLPGPQAQDSANRTGRCERCGGLLELCRQSSSTPAAASPRHWIADCLHLRDVWLAISETWYAWHASRRMLELYQQVRSESGLTGISLYEQIIMRRSRIDIRATNTILRHAEASFCSWPSWHDLRYRDVVQYVVICDYLGSREEGVGTQTRMATTVARIVPQEL